ncbi:MAG TPA: hypothetical protein VFS16_04335 [Acidimicrobiia bacterium]|nr:hypothetical protein [Acidimicrobiia bacterium]
MSRPSWRGRLCGLVLVAAVTAGCSGRGGSPDVAAVVEGTEISADETEALLDGHLKAQSAQDAGDGHAVDGDRTETLTRFVLLYQIKHALLRHLAREMNVSADGGGNPEAEAGRLSHAMAERLFPDIAAPEGAPAEKAGEFVDAQRQSLFTEWFDKQLRVAEVRVDEHFGRWDAERGVVVG